MKILKSILLQAIFLVISFFAGFYGLSQIDYIPGHLTIYCFLFGIILCVIAAILKPKSFGLSAIVVTTGIMAGALHVDMGEGNLVWVAAPAIILLDLAVNVGVSAGVAIYCSRDKKAKNK